MQPIDFLKARANLEQYLQQLAELATRSGLGPSLIALVRLRVSQINGCAHFVDLYTTDARVAGETEQRLASLPVWHESPFFTARERAALEWSEAVTLVAQRHFSDEAWQRLTLQLSSEEILNLTLLAAQSHIPGELWRRLTPQLTQSEIDDLTLLVTIVNTRNRFAATCQQTAELP
jgi:AhpD family alkylhydroperoxidase